MYIIQAYKRITLVPPITPRHFTVTNHILVFAFVDFVMTPVILAELKNSDLIDWCKSRIEHELRTMEFCGFQENGGSTIPP